LILKLKFTVEVGIPPTTALIAKEAGITKGSGTSGKIMWEIYPCPA
jgi:large subunit ribosomal protein L11